MQFENVPPSKDFDRELLRRVTCFLNQKGHAPLRTLEMTVDRGVVLVRGWVPTFYLRQIASECIKRVAGVAQVVDLIEVAIGPVQPQATSNPVGEQEPPAVSARQIGDVPHMAGNAQDASRPYFRRRYIPSSVQ